MSRGKPAGERGEDAGLSTRALAAQAAAIVRRFGLRLGRLEQYLLQVRSQELTELDRLRIRLQALEKLVIAGQEWQRRHSVQVGMPDRWPGRPRPEGGGDDWRARIEVDGGPGERYERPTAGPGAGGNAFGGREEPGAEPVERCPAGEGAAAAGGAGAGGAAGGGAGRAGGAVLADE